MFIKMNERRQKGFTLVELIIVLAIIAILSALAISRIGYNRTKAANTTCNAIMGDIKKAAEAYYADTGQKYTGAIDGSDWLIAGGYMAGVPKQPHNNTAMTYTVGWGASGTSETAVVTCPFDGTTFPPGH